jgi:hypothetical protein
MEKRLISTLQGIKKENTLGIEKRKEKYKKEK